MERKILLNKNRGKRSVNVENGITLPFSANERLLPFDDISDVVNLKEVYDKEKDESDVYRIILTMNPVCTNVLFNTFSEIVYKEGSDECKMLTNTSSGIQNKAYNSTTFNHNQAIRDTEYSHPQICEGLVYHCGTDIFNNHILRNNGFVAVSMGTSSDKGVFNTIKDFNRDKDGKKVTIAVDETQKNKSLHLYNADNLLTFKEAFRNRLVEDDGWFGFTNASLIDIPNVNINGEMITINKVMNNNKACEFIDMFPDRSLFSFIPKNNKYRNRIEKNWDYCLTYPYKNEYEMFRTVNQCSKYPNFSGIKIVKILEQVNDGGISSLFFETMINHNLSEGDEVRLYYVSGEVKKSVIKSKVVGIGDNVNENRKRYFSVSKNTVDKALYSLLLSSYDEETDTFNLEMFFKKETNDGECDYYFRIFRKIPNFATSTKNIYDYNNDVEEVIKACKKDYFKSENSRLSFSQNIFGDKSSQILFTDSIDLTRLVDNNGRKLSEIYLTVVKRNAGYKLWYENKRYGDSNVEYSRAFGKVTSGLNLGLNDKCCDYNVRRLHNVDVSGNAVLRIPSKYKMIEDDITIDKIGVSWQDGVEKTSLKDLFYGDIVERNPYTCNETVLENVYHRFNTAQRETNNTDYSKIVYDVLLQDDNVDGFEYNGNEKEFLVEEREYGKDEGVNNANIAPEGYYYQPHFRLKINEASDVLTEVNGMHINFNTSGFSLYDGTMTEKTGISRKGGFLKVTSPKKYDVKLFDVFLLYKKGDYLNNHYWGFLTSVRNGLEFSILFEDIAKSKIEILKEGIKNGEYILIKTETNIPPYAIPSNNKVYSFKWREIVKPSEVGSDSDLNNRPFTNGTHYIQENINFYLRRQDPFGDYHLQYGVREGDTADIAYNPLIDLTPYGDYKDITAYEYYSDDNFNPCVV